MKSILRPAIVLFLVLTILTGVLYPLAVTGVARLAFAEAAAGSLVVKDEGVIGSALIGQSFADPRNFASRPSATASSPDDASNSSGSNLGPTNPALVEAVKSRVAALKAADPGNDRPVPVDLVTTSASGLDPEIGLEAARWQAARIARLRGMPEAAVQAIIDRHVEPRRWGFLGEPRVNVLAINLELANR